MKRKSAGSADENQDHNLTADSSDNKAAEGSSLHVLQGTVYVFLAEALILPTGLLTAAFLTRSLGLAGYGLFTLAATLVAWIEWSITSVFSRATIKFVSNAGEDWRSVGNTAVWLHTVVSLAAALMLFVLAQPVAVWLHEPALGEYLRLFALDIPLFSIAYAHRSILTGMGSFRERAYLSAGRWVARLILIVALVHAGLSIEGAIIGSIGASVVELIIARRYIQPSFKRSSLSPREFCDYAVPLFLFAVSIRLFERVDFFMLKALGGTAAVAGLYGAAQNLTVVPGIFSLAFSPLLLASLNGALRSGDVGAAHAMSRNALRIVLWMLPFAGMSAGAAAGIVQTLFGADFLSATAPLVLLIFASVAVVMISVATVILVAADKPNWTLALSAPLPLIAIIGDVLLIPRYGMEGAAAVTLVVAAAGAVSALACVYYCRGVVPPAATLVRSLTVSGVASSLSFLYPVTGLLLAVKLSLVSVAIALLFLLLGELSGSEIALVRRTLRRSFAHGRSTRDA